MNNEEFHNAQILPLYLSKLIDQKNKSLIAAYKKEKTMLDIIDRRDEEIKRLRAEASLPGHFEQRYNALASSILGRIQVRYWKYRATKRGKI